VIVKTGVRRRARAAWRIQSMPAIRFPFRHGF
jgi:hypothetical protein